MAGDNPNLGGDELIILDNDLNHMTWNVPVTITGSRNGSVSNTSDSFLLYVNNVLMDTSSLVDGKFSFEYNTDDPSTIGTILSFSIVGKKNGVIKSQLDMDVFVIPPALSDSIYSAYSLLKSILEDEFNVVVVSGGLTSLIEIVGEL